MNDVDSDRMLPRFIRVLGLAIPIVFSVTGSATPLTFRRAVQLAAWHSANTAIAYSDQERAHQAYVEARSAYLPHVYVGSALGYSAGFPLSLEGAAPSIFNVTSQQVIFNPAESEFVKSARAQWQAVALEQVDQRRRAVLDAALTFVDLCRINLERQSAEQQRGDTIRLINIETKRVRAGVDNGVPLIRAKLADARNRVRSAELEGTSLRLRRHLAALTGLSEPDIDPIADSIPPLPEATNPSTIDPAPSSDLRVQIAAAQAHAIDLRAEGERRARWPSVDLVGQYALLSKFNNYDQFYKRFERNNATVGAAVRLGIFNPGQTARQREADAEALKAHKQLDAVKSELSDEIIALETRVEELTAERDVAQLEYVLAGHDTSILDVKAEVGGAKLGDEVTGHILESENFGTLLKATFELQKSQLQLLDAKGELIDWVLAPVTSATSREDMTVGRQSGFLSINQEGHTSIQSLMLAPSVSVLPVRKSRQLFAIAIYNGGADEVTSAAKWFSSNNSIAIVSTTGLLTALAPGMVTISVGLAGVSQSMQVMVSPK